MKKILCFIALFHGCSSSPIKYLNAPDFNRLDYLKTTFSQSEESLILNPSEKIFRRFLKAKTSNDKKLSCKIFTDLSTEREFLLKNLALIYSLSVCKYSESDLVHLLSSHQFEDYLKPQLLEELLKISEEKKLNHLASLVKLNLIDVKNLNSEKITLLNSALNDAKIIQDLELEKRINQKLVEISPRFLQEIPKDKFFIVAKDFEQVRNYSQARFFYQKILNSDLQIEDKFKAYNAYRTTFKIERNLKTFLEKTIEMESFFKEEKIKNPTESKYTELWIDSKILLAKAFWTDQQRDNASKILSDITVNANSSNNQRATTFLILSGINLEEKKYEEAILNLKKGLEQNSNDLSIIENLQWNLIWNQYLLKKFDNVIFLVEKFSKKTSNNAFILKLKFWKMMAYQKIGNKVESSKLLSTISNDEEFDYYGVISHLIDETPLSPIRPDEKTLKPSKDQYLNWIIALDEDKLCEKYLKKNLGAFKALNEKENLMSYLYKCQWYQGAMRQIITFPLKERNFYITKYIQSIFPTPYPNKVAELETKYHVPRELIYAIIRQESMFSSNERSWADAFGLMQIIPEKALEISTKHTIEYKDFTNLYDPEKNIELGTALLSESMEKFHRKFVQVVASYNASESAVKNWEKERFNGDYLEFIESIPYEETRNYVKSVLRNYFIYKRIFNQNEITVPFNFFSNSF